MRSHHDVERAIQRKKPTLLLLMAALFLFFFFVEMTVTVRAQQSPEYTSSEFAHPQQEWSIHEMARRYSITDAVELSFRLQQAEDARREMEKLKKAQQRDRELREKVTELARTSIKLYQRFDNPSETHADTPQLAKKCEELAKAIKKLLR